MEVDTTGNQSRDNFRILAVVVLYHTHPLESVAFQTLQRAIVAPSESKPAIEILLYDNSPSEHNEVLPGNFRYVAAPCNLGLSAAYSCALDLAIKEGHTWLLTLDQDTVLPEDFFTCLSEHIQANVSRMDVGAIVPRVADGDRSLSPVFAHPWGVKVLHQSFVGIAPYETSAVNSGSLFRVRALKQIGGFSRYFWLDQLDADVFRKLHLYGKFVYTAGNILLKHELSTLRAESINPVRFRNYLLAESAFLDLYGTPLERAVQCIRLLGRWTKLLLHRSPKCLRQLTVQAVASSILLSRRRRIHDWQTEMEVRIARLPNTCSHQVSAGKRLSVSVCMAAYNGERFIVEQLKSILCQLDDTDEIVVIDDASKDGTRALIRSLNDPRIRLFEHKQNLGISLTFEDALRYSSNDILFLSDQDDLWVPDKINTVRQAFIDNPHITMVVTDSSLISADGKTFLESYLGKYGPFRVGFFANLFRNRYGAHNTALRASIVSYLLPLPRKHEILHDHWIGLRHALCYGNAYFIDKPMTLSRRHDNTATGRKHISLFSRLSTRVWLLLALAEFKILKWAKRV
jgi:GT2 family glycosyltransferase